MLYCIVCVTSHSLTWCTTPGDIDSQRRRQQYSGTANTVREMEGAPRNPAPKKYVLCGLSCHQAATAQMGT